jgi:hypothetical protein
MRTLTSKLCALGVAVGLSLGVLGAGAPAGAATPNEKFVTKVYEDFLFRAPTSAELTWWTAYLAGGSRTAFVTQTLATAEFRQAWTHGVFAFYLAEYDVDTAPFTTVLSNVTSSGDYVASEVAVIAGAAYFQRAGSTNAGYVETLYEDVLRRPVDGPSLTYWTDRIDNGTWTRSKLANYVIRSTESVNLRIGGLAGSTECQATELVDEQALTAGTYCIVLDRMADAAGIAYWAPRLASTDQLPSAWATFAGTTEYFNLAQL